MSNIDQHHERIHRLTLGVAVFVLVMFALIAGYNFNKSGSSAKAGAVEPISSRINTITQTSEARYIDQVLVDNYTDLHFSCVADGDIYARMNNNNQRTLIISKNGTIIGSYISDLAAGSKIKSYCSPK
jgi:hypothetical protein